MAREGEDEPAGRSLSQSGAENRQPQVFSLHFRKRISLIHVEDRRAGRNTREEGILIDRRRLMSLRKFRTTIHYRFELVSESFHPDDRILFDDDRQKMTMTDDSPSLFIYSVAISYVTCVVLNYLSK